MKATSPRRRAVPVPRRLPRDDPRDALLAAAEKVFAERGLEGTHMSHIAAEAGVATGTLYNYFENREALLGALVDSHRTLFVTAMRKSVASSTVLPFRARLVHLLTALFSSVDRHRPFWLVFLRAEEAQCGAVSAPARRSRTLRELQRCLRVMVDQAVRRREIKAAGSPLYPTLLAGLVWSLINFEGGRSRGLAVEAERVAAVFIDGVGRAPRIANGGPRA